MSSSGPTPSFTQPAHGQAARDTPAAPPARPLGNPYLARRRHTKLVRYRLVLHLHDNPGPTPLADLAALVALPAKTVSDALRADLLNGRVVRLARGVYGPGRLPRSTAHYMHSRLQEARADAA